MERSSESSARTINPNNGGGPKREEEKPKVVVIMGPTGSGKSRLAIDLATHFPIEIINADSMQVYQGLDVLTNKVPLHEQKGVLHHLLGTIGSNVEFTAKKFRDSAIPIISDILSRNSLPVIVGGTNYYIQALVSSFLLDDSAEDVDEIYSSDLPGDEQTDHRLDFQGDSCTNSYDLLKELDPVAANRIHPNNHRKINQYLSMYARSGVPLSKLYQGKAAENWGRVDYSRYSCCFICVDAATPVLDKYLDHRVDCMIDAGLLEEVCDIYNPNANYTLGLRQAIGVREFENFLGVYFSDSRDDGTSDSSGWNPLKLSTRTDDNLLKENIRGILNSSSDNLKKILLEEAIDKVKANTRKLVRRQKRRLNQLQILFGWNINHVDATESISSKSDECWATQVVEPVVKIITSFLNEDNMRESECALDGENKTTTDAVQRDLWTQYTCKACGDRVLRGAHEWEQHQQGRRHRKRMSRLRQSQGFCP